MFSVVIPLYNKEETVARAIRSILTQTVQPDEIIIINDGSTDGSVAAVESFDDSRIKLIHQENAGVSAARNRGGEAAQEELIAFLDADDEWLSGFLEKIQELARKFPNCGLYATRYYLQNSEGARIPAIINGLDEGVEGLFEDYFGVAANSNPPICSSAVCIRKQVFLEIDGFPVGIKSGEDLLTWARIAARRSVAYSMLPLSVFCQGAGETCEAPPSREPASDDIVGRELKKLLAIEGLSRKQARGLAAYMALWHKMRASCYLRLGMRRKAISEAIASLRHHSTAKVILYVFLCCAPGVLTRWLFRKGTSNR